jgi:glycosyltransferase involved in cell wall biosynthesis
MQPIEPPVGGGRLRLLGLYHALGTRLPTRYVGTFDWPGEQARELRLSPTLEELDRPLSPQHFAAHERWAAHAKGRTLIDTCFDLLGGLSPEFLRLAREEIQAAKIVIFTHPWVYPLVAGEVRSSQVLVYDAHNFEGLLRAEIWRDQACGHELARHVTLVESALARRADLVLTCSAEDAALFESIYGVERERLVDAPNGVFVERIRPPEPAQRTAARARLGLSGPAAIFLGSAYQPNVEAAACIIERLAPSHPDVRFLICGGVGAVQQVIDLAARAPNVTLTGQLSERDKQDHLWAGDVALNPMSSGSGTNIKMFDYMAAGLPTVATAIGARGIPATARDGLWVAELDELSRALSALVRDPDERRQAGLRARAFVSEHFAWERISPRLGEALLQALGRRGGRARGTNGAGPPLGWEQPLPIPSVPSTSPARGGRASIALLTTWNARCGIAEYSRYLATALEARGAGCLVLGGIVGGPGVVPAGASGELSISVEQMSAYSRMSPGGVAAACLEAGVRQLLIQYHDGFFSSDALLSIVVACRMAQISVAVTCHNSRKMPAQALIGLCAAGATVLVHSQAELSRVLALGVDRVVHVPHGVLEVADRPAGEARAALGWSRGPVIGTFGFLRPHKGLYELIQAFGLVSDVHPEAKLLALTALYDSADSTEYHERCQQLLGTLPAGCRENVRLDTAFHEIDTILRQLQACDVIVLPYHPSAEGASGSAAISLATRRPVVIARSAVFEDIHQHTYCLESGDPLSIALGICNVLGSPDLLDALSRTSHRFVRERGWSRIAALYRRALAGGALSGADVRHQPGAGDH